MIQVDDVRLMFAEIEQLRQNAWKELLPQEVGSWTAYRQLTDTKSDVRLTGHYCYSYP